MMQTHKSGQIFIISAASGTGKTTLVSRLVGKYGHIRTSVSHTTRKPREGERDGVHYHFVAEADFEKMASSGAFLEYARVYGYGYGTGIEGLNRLAAEGYDVILEIDVQGACQVRRALPSANSIFILPPSLSVLEERLRRRGTEDENVVAARLQKAKEEIEQAFLFDYVVVNDDLDRAEDAVYTVMRACSMKQGVQQEVITAVLDGGRIV